MTWLLPTATLPSGGRIRSVIRLEDDQAEAKREALRAYNRAYYHAKRKGRKQFRTPEQKARRAEQLRAAYARNPDHFRALARSYYWKRKARA